MELLRTGHDPEQVLVILARKASDAPQAKISQETIDTALYTSARDALRRELIDFLRKRPKHGDRARTKPDRRGQVPNQPSIQMRPTEVDQRVIPGTGKGSC